MTATATATATANLRRQALMPVPLLALSLIPLTAGALRDTPGDTGAVGSFAYLGVISMFLGFFAWHRGLAIGPMAQVSQVQLVQPVLSIAWAGLLLGEHLTCATVFGGVAIILCAGSALRVRLGTPR
jgi:drug/metabolite transporter (DMT)-like permease